MDPHRLAEARSLAYHRVIAERLPEEPALLDAARGRIAEWRRDGRLHEAYLAAWEALLTGPPSALIASITADDEAARALRQTTPFAGALDPRERWAIHRAVAEGARR